MYKVSYPHPAAVAGRSASESAQNKVEGVMQVDSEIIHRRITRRTLLVGSGSVLLLAACGAPSASPTAPPAAAPTTAAAPTAAAAPITVQAAAPTTAPTGAPTTAPAQAPPT